MGSGRQLGVKVGGARNLVTGELFQVFLNCEHQIASRVVPELIFAAECFSHRYIVEDVGALGFNQGLYGLRDVPDVVRRVQKCCGRDIPDLEPNHVHLLR